MDTIYSEKIIKNERMIYMTYCEKCGTQISDTANFCPGCGAAVNNVGSDTQNRNTEYSDAAKTAATVAGAAVGVSLLSRMFRRRRRPPMPPHDGPMGGPGGRGPHR